MPVCAVCGEESPDRARFCPGCGAPLSAPLHHQEERKVVTVLFADLVGFTRRSEAMDVEDVRGTLQPYHQLLRGQLERFGGTVEKFIGDAVMALFGAPVAHEDDAERAVRAALAIQQEIARLREADPHLDLHVRIGVNTGEALVALAADPAVGEGMASGDVVNTAARLQTAAPVDGVLVGEATLRATRRAVEYAPAPPIAAKGKSEPVPVWVAQGLREGIELDRPPVAPMVGRDAERERLLGALERAQHEHTLQLVTVVGVPGIGKSRLLADLRHRVEASPDGIAWRQGRSLPYGEGVTYWALAEVAKAEAGVRHSDPADVVSRKLREAVAAVVPARDADWIAGHLRPLLGVDPAATDATDRAESFAAWRRFLEALAEARPTVLVFEDLHWADDALLDFLDYLVEWSSGVPLLLIATARPELLDRRKAFGTRAANADCVVLAPLSDEHAARLLSALLDRVTLPAETERVLLTQAAGNPLYAEEYVRMLHDRGLSTRFGTQPPLRGGDALPLPETVHGLIAARIDGLPAEEKAALQDASVIGKAVWPGAVAHIAGRGRWAVDEELHRLAKKEFLRKEPASSVEDEAEYAFRHALIRDVAYGGIVRAQRALKHQRAAEWMESLAGDRGDRAELLAHHYGTARALAHAARLPADPELERRATRAIWEAGRRAFALRALPSAVSHFAQALEIDALASGERARLQLDYGRAAAFADGSGREALEAARAVFEAQGERAPLAETEALLGDLAAHAGEWGRARMHFERAHAIARDLPSAESKVRVLTAVATAVFVAGDNDAAVPLAEDAVAAAEEAGNDELRGKALAVLGTARAHSTRTGGGDGMVQLDEAVALLARIDSHHLFAAYGYLGVIASEAGDLVEDRAILAKARQLERRHGPIPRWRDWIAGWEMQHDYWSGAWDAALEKPARVAGSYDRAFLHLIASRILWARGSRAEALDLCDHAVNAGRSAGETQLLLPALALSARLRSVAGGDPGPLVGELLELWSAVWNLSTFLLGADFAYLIASTASAHRLLDEASRPAGGSRWLDAAQAIRQADHVAAAAVYQRMGALPDEATAREHAARQLLQSGHTEAAERELERARAFWRTVGATKAMLVEAASLCPGAQTSTPH